MNTAHFFGTTSLDTVTVGKAQVQRELVELQREIYLRTNGGKRPGRFLIPRLTDRRNLLAAWYRVSHANGANTAGPDGKTCKRIAPKIGELLDQLADQLTNLQYRPGSVRTIEVPKKPGQPGTRTLTLLNVRDRIVHAAIKQILEPLLEPRFDRRSFGFRPGRSVARAAQALCERLARVDRQSTEFAYVTNVDIADCFDSIDVDILLRQLAAYVDDERFMRLMESILRAYAHPVGFLRVRHVGIPQGSPLSPLLCNLYLHALDERLGQIAYEYGDADFFRYADDIVIFARSRTAMYRALRTLRRTLRDLGLRTRQRPRIQRVSQGFEWLGLRFVPRRRPWFSGVRFACEIPDEKVTEMIERIDEMTAPPSQRLDASVVDLGRWIVSLNTQLKQWASIYRITLNSREVFLDLDDHVYERVGQLIRSVTGLPMAAVREQFSVELPRGFRTWQVNGCQLAVLGALKPTRRETRIAPPAWKVRRSEAIPATVEPTGYRAPAAIRSGQSEDDFLLQASELPEAPAAAPVEPTEVPPVALQDDEPWDTELPTTPATADGNGKLAADPTPVDSGNEESSNRNSGGSAHTTGA